MNPLLLIDTHTGGEPTRVVFNDGQHGANDVGRDAMEIRRWLREDADWIRRSILREPRGCESMVGAWVTMGGGPSKTSASLGDDSVTASLVFFNNSGYLGMCGHGLIGVVEAMRHQGVVGIGQHRLATPAGEITATLHDDHRVSFENVASYRYRKDVAVPVDISIEGPNELSLPHRVVGDIAYGGNWFFLIKVPSVEFSELESLMRYSQRIKAALQNCGITGADGAEIDHIELCQSCHDDGQPMGRTFVLCPGGHYDRSPCGTGTSAKVACLADEGDLLPGQTWIQESVIGSRFTATHRVVDGQTRVTVTGRAYVTGETKCLFDENDPFRFGIDLLRESQA